jgi:hypothetical protein
VILLTLRLLTEEEAAESDAMRDRRSWYESLDCLLQEQCVDDHGAHDWWLGIDPDDGVDFHCLRCSAGVDYIWPDGIDLLSGDFEVLPGYVLSVQTGIVQVNGRETYGLFTYGWRGRVTAQLVVEPGGYWTPDDISAWIELEACSAA